MFLQLVACHKQRTTCFYNISLIVVELKLHLVYIILNVHFRASSIIAAVRYLQVTWNTSILSTYFMVQLKYNVYWTIWFLNIFHRINQPRPKAADDEFPCNTFTNLCIWWTLCYSFPMYSGLCHFNGFWRNIDLNNVFAMCSPSNLSYASVDLLPVLLEGDMIW